MQFKEKKKEELRSKIVDKEGNLDKIKEVISMKRRRKTAKEKKEKKRREEKVTGKFRVHGRTRKSPPPGSHLQPKIRKKKLKKKRKEEKKN